MTVAIDADKLMGFVFKAVDEVGATLNAALVVMGDRLGYYQALSDQGPATPSELAEWTSTDEHYTREWLNAQAAGGIVEYDASTGRYTLPPEHAVAMTDPSSPAYLPGFFQIALGTLQHTTDTIEAARSGAGVGWHEHTTDVHVGCERFFRPSYNANLLPSWLPALDGVVEKLQRGATVADIGCGHGSSTILMAEAFPRISRVFNGWMVSTHSMGVYGNYYLKRAIIARVGLGANPPEDAIYPVLMTDADGAPLTGDNDYICHFEAGQTPPVDAFWSVTMYDEHGFQAANSLNRFALGDRDPLTYNSDGSLDIYFQRSSPGTAKEPNWLPAPSGPLGITMRLYAPRSEALDGRWTPPPVRRVK